MRTLYRWLSIRVACVVAAASLGAVVACQPRQSLPSPVAATAPAASGPRAQNPSPMVERTRRHERVPQGQPPGMVFTIDSVLTRPVTVFIPERAGADAQESDERTLLVHLFSAPFLPMNAVATAGGRYVLAVVNLGGGSSAYERPLSDTATWGTLIRRVHTETRARARENIRIGRTFVSAFSAGYGGVRALLSDERIAKTLDGVLLLDGLHTSYIPERSVIAEGGMLDTLKLEPFLRYARRAVAGDARFLITHSEIFPGTFASTTETSDWLIKELGLARTPVLAWGPGGMQQISEVKRGRLQIFGYAGNTGPDHIDHLHGLAYFLARMDR